MRLNCSLIYCFIFIICIDISLSNECLTKARCGECISTSFNCLWCSDDSFENRCNTRENLERQNCTKIFPSDDLELQKVKIISDTPLSRTDKKIVQLTPQRIELKMRPYSKVSFDIQFSQAIGYPVDLYYLLDLSNTMKDHKTKLATLGHQLATEMRKITNDFKLGFGSFIDKPVMPYIDITPKKLVEPCRGCVPTYGFRNHMNLSDDTERFVKQIMESPTSGNLDGPEGSFDAIMQAIVCKEKLGWRKQSDKLLVIATDASFHYAGDGKLAGILKPNDEKCHLDDNNVYTESATQDYPSINQISMVVQENNINLIFTVTKLKSVLYTRLSKEIENSKVATLADDSANVVELIKEAYNKITSKLVLKDNLPDDSTVSIRYESSCLGGKLKETAQCEDIRPGNVINFTVTVEVKSCPQNIKKRNQTIRIKPSALSDELLIDLQIICECDCEKEKNIEVSSKKCNGQGTYECGICSCNDNYYGKQCQCQLNSGKVANEETCRNGNDTKLCSGNGECSCGQCLCRTSKTGEKYYGKFCQCDRVSCTRLNGEVCGGSDHGICDCGTCKCNAFWEGDACECSKKTDACIDGETGLICSGQGQCKCGKCVCDVNKNGEAFTGSLCNYCPTCTGKCNLFNNDAKKFVDSNGHYNESKYRLVLEDHVKAEYEEKLCEFLDERNCKYIFKYEFDGTGAVRKGSNITVQRSKQCPEKISVTKVGAQIVSGILLIGLLTLILWKLITHFHDKREFEKFEKEVKNANWEASQNPIFKPSTAEFSNPTFGRMSVYQ